MTNTERYALAAYEAGVPRDQFENFSRAQIVLSRRQLLAAAAARLCDHRCPACNADAIAGRDPNLECTECGPTDVGYGGARGGGKSHWGLGQIFCDDGARYDRLKFLYLRKVGKTGDEAIDDLRKSVLRFTPHHYHGTKKILTRIDNGSTVRIGHFHNENDIDQYLGIEYDGALIEEATQLSAGKVCKISTCIRTSKPNWRPRQYYTTNPGGIGHGWFKAKFIKPLRDNCERTTRFIQATIRDNPHVDPENRAKLFRLDGWLRKAWLEGEWDLGQGTFFTNYRRGLIARDLPIGLDGRPGIPDHWRVWLGFDYGITHYTCCYLMAADADGNVWAVHEHAERGWTPQDHAPAIKSMLRRYGLEPPHLKAILAGGDAFNSQRDGKSTADDYEALGLRMERADNDRINGAAEIFRRLGNPESTPPRRPSVFITPNCPRLLECLPELQRDPKRPEDVLKIDCDEEGIGGDDPYDAFRYGVMYAAVKPARWGRSPL